MFMGKIMRMPVFMGRLPMIVHMLMNQVYLEQQIVVFQYVLRVADLFNPVFFRQEGHPRM